MRNGDYDDLEYKKMLVRVFIDRIYLYDDHLHILLKNSAKMSKVTDENALVIEEYFDNYGSTTDKDSAP